MAGFVPKEALDYLKKKSLKPAFSYRDVWNEEHATAFTVAKATQLDVLTDIKDAVEKAVADGQSFESFRKNLAPTLQAKGWWGRKTMVDPKTGETVDAQLGSDRRLKTIYQVNTRQAYLKGAWDRGMASTAHPYIMYCLGPSAHHRDDHKAWAGLVLPKDDPFWNTHAPMNGWGCKCFLRFLSQSKFEQYKAEGAPVGPNLDGTKERMIPIQTERPPMKYRTWVDKRTGLVERIPNGISPGFGWNPGQTGREVPTFSEFLRKTRASYPQQFQAVAETVMKNTVKRDQFRGFIDGANSGNTSGDSLTAVGFLDDQVVDWLVKNRNKSVGAGTVIVLEGRLVKGPKATRHALAGDALSSDEWKGLIETLLGAQVFFEESTGNLVYLGTNGEKVVIDLRRELQRRGASINQPLVVSAYKASPDELKRIFGLQKVK
jgi:hypothetical protein